MPGAWPTAGPSTSGHSPAREVALQQGRLKTANTRSSHRADHRVKR